MNPEELLKQATEPQMLDHKKAVDTIMDCEDFKQLAQIIVGLERRAGQLDVKLAREQTATGLAAGRAEKRVAISLMSLAQTRTKFLKDTNSRLNHNFRQVAKEVLPAEVYGAIEKEARFPLKKGSISPEVSQVVNEMANERFKRDQYNENQL